MNSTTQQIYAGIFTLASFEPTKLDPERLTHPEVRDMLVLVRRLKVRLEVLDAEMEKN